MTSPHWRYARTLFRRFATATNAAVAVEFAFIAPIMIVMFFGTVELSDGLGAQQRVTQMATTTADLAAQATTLHDADVTNIFAAVSAIDYPGTPTQATIVLSSIVDNGKGGGTVAWSSAQNTTALGVGQTVITPTGLIPSGGSVIQATVTNPYTPLSNFVVSGTITFRHTAYSTPRASTTVARVTP